MAEFQIRAATKEDMPGVERINRHYVLNTVITFATEPKTVEQFVRQFDEIARDGLPYIVAVEPNSADVLGYANAHAFRDVSSAYKYTVEISLFCANGQTGRGIGSKLLKALIDALKEPLKHPELRAQGAHIPPRPVKQALAVMAVDETAKRNGLALKEFYESFGFRCNGHLRQVGYKFDRWIDTMYLQLSL
ncbi:hypothetical protein NKR23_g4100 [Pleurostoma richardsiae]|uniref:N-acetyltransferase domain-containing protein n=1 Tax=Pleurostoma richardsiae TaxID=41990 RepID=A0AA38RKG0_9PEZI|nr:hypothetical protein NKR23_g4100 [Pleurostoma richardsiae]